jgi:hypothetical protein
MSVIVNPSLTVILSEAKDLVAKNLARGKLREAIPPHLRLNRDCHGTLCLAMTANDV